MKTNIRRFGKIAAISLAAAALFGPIGHGVNASAQIYGQSQASQVKWERNTPRRTLRSQSPRLEFQQFAAARISAQEAKSIAMRAVPGSEFLDIRLLDGQTYRVRVIKDGRRVDVYVDAQTGRVRR